MKNGKLLKTPFNWEKEETNCNLDQDFIWERNNSDGNCSINSFSSSKMSQNPLKKKGGLKDSHREKFVQELSEGKIRTRRQRFQNGRTSFYQNKFDTLSQKGLSSPEFKRHSASPKANQLKLLLWEAHEEEDKSPDYSPDSDYFELSINEWIRESSSDHQGDGFEDHVLITMQDVMPSKRPSN